MSRVIRIFLSTPNDVLPEQTALKSLVNELNDFLIFLTPEKDVRIEVIHYETSMYPDIEGAPQDTVDRQLPEDYEIHFGIMWKRCGTPTKNADSGTIHEFDLALKRREKVGRPIIMFYFSNEKFELPSSQNELEQITKVMKFRDRISTIGLTVLYPSRESFRERARIGLLRAVADILRDKPSQQKRLSQSGEPSSRPTDRIIHLAGEYEKVRMKMNAGTQRTRKMTEIFGDMLAEAPHAKSSINSLQTSTSAGLRLAAIAVLQTFPDVDYLEWLSSRLEPEIEKPFVGYQAAVALLQASRSFPASMAEILRKYINDATNLAKRNPNDPDRLNVLDYAMRELDLKNKAILQQ